MPLSSPFYARLIGVGSFAPAKVLTNADLEEMVDTSDEWISTRTGIKERRIAEEGFTCSDLAVCAAEEALRNANIVADDIDLIIVATITPDMLFPSTACFVQKKIKAHNAVAFDISAACSGYVYAMSIASNFIANGQYKTVLVIGSELLSKFVDWEDRSTCILFGDGAGAAVLQVSKKKEGILRTYLDSDAKYTDLLYLPGGGSLYPASPASLQNGLHTIKMKGNEVFKIAVNTMVESVQKILEIEKLTIDDISCIIPHQANIRIIKAVGKRLNAINDQVYINVDRFGNTSAATIAIALDEVIKHNVVKKGDLVLCVAFGAGFTSGAMLLKI